MAHNRGPVRWVNHLLIYALRQEEIAEAAGVDQLATQIQRGVRWHPLSEVIASVSGAPTRAEQSAAARALANLEAKKFVTVFRTGGQIDRYKLRVAGRSRAQELAAHGGVSRSTAKRRSKRRRAEIRREAAHSLGRRTPAEWTKYRQELEDELFKRHSSKLWKELLKTPLSKPFVVGEERLETYGDLPVPREAWRNEEMESAVRLMLLVFELGQVRYWQEMADKHSRQLHEEDRFNDSIWPEARQRLIDEGVPIHPGSDWRQLKLGLYERAGLKYATLTASLNPLVLGETVDEDADNPVQD